MDLPVEVAQFVNKLVPTDVGVDSVGDFVIHYEGFTDECNDGYNDNSIDEVYAEVYQDFDNRQGSEALIRGVSYDELGCDNNPVLYSVYKNISESDKFGKVRGMADPGGVAVNMLNDPKISSIQKEQIRNSFMKDYNIDTLPIPGDFINHSELGNVKVLKIIDVDIYGGPAEYEIENSNGKIFPITFDELTDMIGYGDISDVPQTLKNSFDFQLVNQEISEARLFRTTRSFGNLTGEDIAKLLYLSSLSSYMMLKDDGQNNYAEQYIKQTVQYGPYTLFRSHATDLYLLAYQVKNPDNRSINLKNTVTSRIYLEKLNFDDKKHYSFFRKASNRSITKTEVGMFFLRLESQLKISDNRYRSWRRLITDWENLKYSSRQLVVTKILQEYRRLGKGSELVGPLTNMAKYKSYTISDKYKEPKTSLKTRVAGTAAGAVAGRYAGKKIAQKLGKDVDKYKKAGTGIGAIAGYWASGRIKK